MTKYQQHLKPHWDTIGWFSTIMVRIATTDDEMERKELLHDLSVITDEMPELRPYGRKAGASCLPDDYPMVSYE